MKTIKLLIFTFLFLYTSASFAQNETDALRLSQNYSGGTARVTGMGGAFGALGGDVSTLSINPAGIGVYRSTEFTITPTINVNNSKSNFLGSNYTDSKYAFNLSNLGYVFTLKTQNDKGLVSLSFGFGYNRLADFNKNVTIQTNAANSSLLDGFASFINGNTDQTLSEKEQTSALQKNYPIQAMAYNTYAINYDSASNSFFSDFDRTGQYGQSQMRQINTKGGIGEYDFSIGGNINNMFYFGATMGVQNIYYEEITNHNEYNININSSDRDLKDFTFTDNFKMTGSGLNFKIGAIIKPVDFLRLGLAWHTPTFYSVTTESYNTMLTNFYNGDQYTDKTDINSYNSDVRTSSKIIASAGFVIKQLALIDIDYEHVDYSTIHMRADDYSYANENTNIQNNFKSTYNLKLGAEFKFGDFAVRGGYGFYGSPDKNNSDLSTNSYSGGLGYRGENFFIDFGYTLAQTKYTHTLYSYIQNNANVDVNSKINSNTGRYLMTVGFKF